MTSASLSAGYIPEPLLVFGGSNLHVNPRSGIARYGPLSYSPRRSHPNQVRVGVIGSALTVTASTEWLRAMAAGVQPLAAHGNADPRPGRSVPRRGHQAHDPSHD